MRQAIEIENRNKAQTVQIINMTGRDPRVAMMFSLLADLKESVKKQDLTKPRIQDRIGLRSFSDEIKHYVGEE